MACIGDSILAHSPRNGGRFGSGSLAVDDLPDKPPGVLDQVAVQGPQRLSVFGHDSSLSAAGAGIVELLHQVVHTLAVRWVRRGANDLALCCLRRDEPVPAAARIDPGI